jgi:hypothetical protein
MGKRPWYPPARFQPSEDGFPGAAYKLSTDLDFEQTGLSLRPDLRHRSRRKPRAFLSGWGRFASPLNALGPWRRPKQAPAVLRAAGFWRSG